MRNSVKTIKNIIKMTGTIEIAIERLKRLREGDQINTASEFEAVNKCIAELLDLQAVEQDEVENAYRWGFVDGQRYSNGTTPFYTSSHRFYTETYKTDHRI